jgi:predicted nucleic acid-binding protein
MILLDTNIVSELIRPKPDSGVVAWLEETGGRGRRAEPQQQTW